MPEDKNVFIENEIRRVPSIHDKKRYDDENIDRKNYITKTISGNEREKAVEKLIFEKQKLELKILLEKANIKITDIIKLDFYPFGSDTEDAAYWENGGWLRDLADWVKRDSENNGYIFAGQGFGEESGRASAGNTHTIDIASFTRVFSSIGAGGSKIIEIIIQQLEGIGKISSLGAEAEGLFKTNSNQFIVSESKTTTSGVTIYYNKDGKSSLTK